jgi:two-component system OmpR family response regulator
VRALVVEDEAALAAQIAAALAEAGFAVDTAADGETASFMGATETYDLVVLDIGLPRRDGVAVLEEWRGENLSMPVLILTARDAWSEKVRGFRAGADDYLTKPFRMEEVILRARSLVRRAAGHAKPVLRCGGLALDTGLGLFTLDGAGLKLTAFEARILGYLMHHAGKVVSRTELSDHVYDSARDPDFNSMEVVIGRLRRKIGRERIETVRGEGYRLLDPAAAPP